MGDFPKCARHGYNTNPPGCPYCPVTETLFGQTVQSFHGSKGGDFPSDALDPEPNSLFEPDSAILEEFQRLWWTPALNDGTEEGFSEAVDEERPTEQDLVDSGLDELDWLVQYGDGLALSETTYDDACGWCIVGKGPIPTVTSEEVDKLLEAWCPIVLFHTAFYELAPGYWAVAGVSGV
ncbi:hypothetical protein KW797_00130 [Candidatus Parcubacteria bacterium]|nr:hypothetical protein [Candidatus Parcubacteria bacterium]